MIWGGVISGNCETGSRRRQIRPARTMMIATVEANTGRSIKKLTMVPPLEACAVHARAKSRVVTPQSRGPLLCGPPLHVLTSDQKEMVDPSHSLLIEIQQ